MIEEDSIEPIPIELKLWLLQTNSNRKRFLQLTKMTIGRPLQLEGKELRNHYYYLVSKYRPSKEKTIINQLLKASSYLKMIIRLKLVFEGI